MKQPNGSVKKMKDSGGISILLADDHAVLRSGLRLLIDEQTDMKVVGEAGDFQETFQKVKELRPDIVVLDITMPGDDPFVEIKHVLESFPKSRVLVLSMHEDGAYLQKVLEAGASGYVCKKIVDTELISAIRAVFEGRTFVDLQLSDLSETENHISETLASQSQDDAEGLIKLSPREKEVLILLAKGHTNQQIATQLNVGIKSVETYRGRVMNKLDLQDRSELFHYAKQYDLL